MNSYHFDLGNSNTGPIGLCARVKADTVEEALVLLRGALPAELKVPYSKPDPDRGVEYLQVYFNGEAITWQDIDEVNPEERELLPSQNPEIRGTGEARI